MVSEWERKALKKLREQEAERGCSTYAGGLPLDPITKGKVYDRCMAKAEEQTLDEWLETEIGCATTASSPCDRDKCVGYKTLNPDSSFTISQIDARIDEVAVCEEEALNAPDRATDEAFRRWFYAGLPKVPALEKTLAGSDGDNQPKDIPTTPQEDPIEPLKNQGVNNGFFPTTYKSNSIPITEPTFHTPTKVGKVSDTTKNTPTQPKKINKGIKVRIYPNKEQEILLNKTLGSCRFIHNKMLEEHNKVYEELKEDKDQLYAHKYKTEKQYKEEYAFLKEVDSKALQSETNNLDQAFKNFFQGLKKGRKVGYPQFRSKKRKQPYTTYNINNNTRVDPTTKRIRLPKVGWVKYRDNRELIYPIKHVTVSKTKTNKYFVAIIVEVEIDVEPLTTIPLHRIEAFDMSAPNFLVNETVALTNPRFYRNHERKLKRLHKLVSRKQKGSQNRENARLRLAKGYEKIHNQKLDWTHKLTHSLSTHFDAIILEDLNIQGMQQFNSGLAKSVTLDFSWHQFLLCLRYKLEWQGKPLVLVDRFFPSSKRCSVCGQRNNDLHLSERTWTCPCGATHHRDVNASINIKEEGLLILRDQGITVIHDNHSTVGTTGSHASGDRVSPASAGGGRGRRNPSAFRQW